MFYKYTASTSKCETLRDNTEIQTNESENAAEYPRAMSGFEAVLSKTSVTKGTATGEAMRKENEAG